LLLVHHLIALLGVLGAGAETASMPCKNNRRANRDWPGNCCFSGVFEAVQMDGERKDCRGSATSARPNAE
jgi:hypothetical protein